MANLLLLQDKLGEDFKSKRTRRASKAALAGKLANGMSADSPGKDAPHLPAKYQLKEDDDKQVRLQMPNL
jgi:hypothetical protein